MPFVFLLMFALIYLNSVWPAPPWWLAPEHCAFLVGTLVVTSWLSAEVIALTVSWQMIRRPELRFALLRRFARWRRWHFIGLLGAYLAMLFWLGWGDVFADFLKWWIPEAYRSNENLPGFQFGLLVPFFAALVLSWERFYQVERTAYELGHDDDRFISKRTYLLLQIRHQLLLVMPPIFLLLLVQVLYAIFPSLNDDSFVPVFVMVALMVAAFITMPLVLRIFLGLTPLPPGPLRDRLEQTARRLRFGYSNVLVWDTRNLFANAMVTGFVPWLRYIVLTDRLIDELTPEEIEAVFGHEIGHIKHHHLLFYLAFFLSSFVLLGLFWEAVKDWIRQDDVMSALQALPWLGAEPKETLRIASSFVKLGLLSAYTLGIFGYFSRRCERQADLFGSCAVSTEAFINALEKVAAINGIPRDRAGNWLVSWQHPTIAQRVEFLETMRDRPDLIPRFHRSLTLLKGAYFLVLAFLLWQLDLTKIWMLLKEF